MTYSYESQVDEPSRPQDCTRGGGRNNPGVHAVDIMHGIAYSYADPEDPAYRLIDQFGEENLADELKLSLKSMRTELVQMAKRGVIARLPDGQFRFEARR